MSHFFVFSSFLKWFSVRNSFSQCAHTHSQRINVNIKRSCCEHTENQLTFFFLEHLRWNETSNYVIKNVIDSRRNIEMSAFLVIKLVPPNRLFTEDDFKLSEIKRKEKKKTFWVANSGYSTVQVIHSSFFFRELKWTSIFQLTLIRCVIESYANHKQNENKLTSYLKYAQKCAFFPYHIDLNKFSIYYLMYRPIAFGNLLFHFTEHDNCECKLEEEKKINARLLSINEVNWIQFSNARFWFFVLHNCLLLTFQRNARRSDVISCHFDVITYESHFYQFKKFKYLARFNGAFVISFLFDTAQMKWFLCAHLMAFPQSRKRAFDGNVIYCG